MRHIIDAWYRLSLYACYPGNAALIRVDRRTENLGRRTRIDLGLVGDVKEIVAAEGAILSCDVDTPRIWASTLLAMSGKAERALSSTGPGMATSIRSGSIMETQIRK